MAFDPFTAAFDLIKTGLEKWIPDANQREKAALELAGMVQQINLAQTEINKIEAASQNLFVAGWRPAIGWICGAGYAYAFIVQPFLIFTITAFQVQLNTAQLPTLDIGEMSLMLANLLGFGAMRTYEKVKGNGTKVQ